MKAILGFAAPKALQTPKLVFLKGSLRLPFKKPIFIMRIAGKNIFSSIAIAIVMCVAFRAVPLSDIQKQLINNVTTMPTTG